MSHVHELEKMDPDRFRKQLRLLLADRSSPEAAAMFQVLMKKTGHSILPRRFIFFLSCN